MDLDRLEELHKKATPGPWHADSIGVRHQNGKVCELRAIPERLSTFGEGRRQVENDMRFIAVARNALPDLVARIRELEAENAKLREGKDVRP